MKASWRFIRTWICHNTKVYYSYVILCAFTVYNFWWYAVVGRYRRINAHCSLAFAIQKEKEWALNKPKDEDEYGSEE